VEGSPPLSLLNPKKEKEASTIQDGSEIMMELFINMQKGENHPRRTDEVHTS
jgi:hypothetical protein